MNTDNIKHEPRQYNELKQYREIQAVLSLEN